MRSEIVLLAIIVLASGCMDNDENVGEVNNITPTQSQSSNISTTENTIYLTESGFQPSDLTIEQGETVNWINNASNSMWVASDQHPSHTNYADSTIYQHCQRGDQTEAAFDQCSSGEEFSFTFEKTGEWNYHNHDRAVQGGTVTVQ